MEPQDIQIRDREAELAGLKLECREQAENLTSILISVDTAKKDLIDIDTKKAEFDEYVVKTTILLKEENDRINAEKVNLIGLKETSTKELKQIQNDTKAANKDLSLANDRVFKAKGEIEDLLKQKEHVILKVSELNLLVEMLPKLQTDISNLEEKRNELRKEISEMLDASTSELTKAREELVKITKEVEKKIEEANQAEYKCKKYVDELYTHMNDYEIVKMRLETVYNTKFPELDLKI